MRWCLAPDVAGRGRRETAGWRLRPVADDGTPSGPEQVAATPAELAAALSRSTPPGGVAPRVVWADSARELPPLLDAGVRPARCHDLALVEALLLGVEGRWGRPRSLAAAWARRHGLPEPPDPVDPAGPAPAGPGTGAGAGTQDALFEAGALAAPAGPATGPPDLLAAVVEVHADQQRRIAAAAAAHPGLPLLAAAESAAGLAAAEMSRVGLPWDAAVHDAVLAAALGPRPAAAGSRPARLQELAEQVAAALGDSRLNPDSQPDLLRALHRAGLPVASTRRGELRRVDHPAIGPLLDYKELARLHAAHGWAWREQWVRDGRFHPGYVPGGVVSGRWATRGGGALQIPRAVRAAVVAPPGRALVVADAGQLEPRVLAALSGDPALVAATHRGDLYTNLAERALGGATARAEAKLAMLSAMYGGGHSPALVALRRHYPTAMAMLEAAAATGEAGRSVHSALGRCSPAAAPDWLAGLSEPARAARERARGRFTRNFVIQASAADWACVLLATLRTELLGTPAELVFFQHDEVLVETDASDAARVAAAVERAGEVASWLVLGHGARGDTGVRVPLAASVVRSYAEKEAPVATAAGR